MYFNNTFITKDEDFSEVVINLFVAEKWNSNGCFWGQMLPEGVWRQGLTSLDSSAAPFLGFIRFISTTVLTKIYQKSVIYPATLRGKNTCSISSAEHKGDSSFYHAKVKNLFCPRQPFPFILSALSSTARSQKPQPGDLGWAISENRWK